MIDMKVNSVNDVRQFFVDELKDEAFTIDKTGAKTIEMIGASFLATEESIFGVPNEAYINQELLWYHNMSTNIKDIYGEHRNPPAAWQYAANSHGEINSNYGKLIFSDTYNNQYDNVLTELLENPDGRRATCVYNRPNIWLDYKDNGKNDFICTNAVSYYIRDGLLHSVVQMRSNDVVFGYKNDYAWQMHIVQKLCDDYNFRRFERTSNGNGKAIEPALMTWQVQNLHVYERHFDLVV
jgi:thymidylate synthase